MVAMSAILAVSLFPALPRQAEAASLKPGVVSVEVPLQASSNSNGSMGTARTIPLNSGATAVFDTNDVEYSYAHYWFKFKTTSRNSVYKVRVATIDTGQVDYTLMSEDGDTLVSSYLSTSWHGPVTVDWVKLRSSSDKNSWMYIHLECYYRNCSYGDRFQVSVNEYPVLKKVTGLKASKKAKTSLTVKWGKQSNATKYQVRYRAKGGSWKVKTVKSNSVKLTKLKKNKQYQVKVRAYNKYGYNHTSDKASAWGPWSSAITIKTKR